MGRLAGFRYRDVVRKLSTFGWVFDRHGAGSHKIWRHPPTGRRVTLPHHARDMAEGDPPRRPPRTGNRRGRVPAGVAGAVAGQRIIP